MTTYLEIMITIYIISLLYCRYWLKIAYSKEGRWYNLNPSLVDLFIVLMPVYNTVGAIIFLFSNKYKNQDQKTIHTNWFFGIKK
jgi:hypothetical protein